MSFENIVEALQERDFCILPAWLSQDEVAALTTEFSQLQDQGEFKAAGISKNQQFAREVRRDEICWFEPNGLLPAQKILWERFENIKAVLNRELYLGLWDLEGHFASYAKGGFYLRHLDRFASDDARTVTVVLYLNEDWSPEHGGELVIFTAKGPIHVEPRAGTLVIFMSAKIEHEVRESHAPRRSFAGWYRRRK